MRTGSWRRSASDRPGRPGPGEHSLGRHRRWCTGDPRRGGASTTAEARACALLLDAAVWLNGGSWKQERRMTVSATDEAVLDVQGVRKTYEAEAAPVRALRGVTMSMAGHEVVGGVGPAGGGE